MSQNWVLALDNLAAGGTIDFDAPAYILGKEPRYIGNPDREHLPLENPMYLPENIKLKDVPDMDTYGNPEDKPLQSNPSWKSWLLGIMSVGALVFGGYKLSKLFKGAKKAAENVASEGVAANKNLGEKLKDMFSKIKTADYKALMKSVLEYAKKPFVWVAGKFKK